MDEMNDKLKEILKGYYFPYNRKDVILLNKTIKKFLSWHIREQKKWAMRLVKQIESEEADEEFGVDDVTFKWTERFRKKIEKG